MLIIPVLLALKILTDNFDPLPAHVYKASMIMEILLVLDVALPASHAQV